MFVTTLQTYYNVNFRGCQLFYGIYFKNNVFTTTFLYDIILLGGDIMNTRLKLLRKTLKKTQPEFGKLCGKSRDAIATYESGRVIPDDAFIKVVCLTFNVNEDWLRTGAGDMFIKSEDDLFEAFAEKYKLDEQEQALARYCLSMTHEERQLLIKHILNMADAIRGKQKFSQVLKPDKELTVDEKLERIRPQLEAAEKGKISTASTTTNGQGNEDKAV